MSKNALDAFEQRLKDSLEQFEVPYNSSDWNQLERSLNNGRSNWWFSADLFMSSYFSWMFCRFFSMVFT